MSEISLKFRSQMPNESIQLDIQKQLLSGVNSPAAVSSPSCEVKSELVFPSLPAVQGQPQQQQQQQQPQSYQEPAKVTPKISQLSELDQQLSKLHNQRPVLSQPQGQPAISQTYSEAVRQSPTTVQQQFVQPNLGQQVQTTSQNAGPQAPLNLMQNIQATNQVVTPVALQTQAGDPLRKLSRFVISKVIEEPKAQPQPQQQQQLNQNQPLQQQTNQVPKSTVNTPDNDSMQQQQQQSSIQSPSNVQPMVPSQGNQAQMFFQQHHGGVVSEHLDCFRFLSYRLY